MRRLHVQHHVEAGLRERQPLGITDLETQALDLMTPLAVTDAFGIEIQADVSGRLIGPGEIGRPAPMPAADFEHAPAGQGDVSADMLIELNVGAVRFVVGG